MNVDPAAILALISTLTAQNAQLAQENASLRSELQVAAKRPQDGGVVLTEGDYKVYKIVDKGQDFFTVSWGGQWLTGSYPTAEDALLAGKKEVAGD